MREILAYLSEKIKNNDNIKVYVFSGLIFALIINNLAINYLIDRRKMVFKPYIFSDSFSVGISGESGESATKTEMPVSVVRSEKDEMPYLASINGSRYYLSACSGAKRIKEGNIIRFKTKKDAESAGYSPAVNCPGI